MNRIFLYITQVGIRDLLKKILLKIPKHPLLYFLLRSYERLILEKNGVSRPLTLPDSIQIEPTNRCNLQCTTCNRHLLSPIGDLSFSLFKTAISQFPFLSDIRLQGMGEPLLNKDIYAMAAYAHKQNIHCTIVTNGTILPEPQKLESLIQCCSRIIFSVDSADVQTFESLRTGACFQTVISHIREFCKIRDKRNRSCRFFINCVISSQNHVNVHELFELSADIGIDEIEFVPVECWSVKKDAHISAGSCVDLTVCKQNIYTSSQKTGIPYKFRDPLKNTVCPWYRRTCYIDHQGFIMPCCIRPDYRTFTFGNIFHSRLKHIWNSVSYRTFREQLNSNTIPAICINCSKITRVRFNNY